MIPKLESAAPNQRGPPGDTSYSGTPSCTSQLAASATDYVRLTELGDQLRSVQDEKAGLEERWLALAEELSG